MTKLSVRITFFLFRASRALLVEVCHLRASCSVVQTVQSGCPVSYLFWAIAVYIYNLPAMANVILIVKSVCIIVY